MTKKDALEVINAIQKNVFNIGVNIRFVFDGCDGKEYTRKVNTAYDLLKRDEKTLKQYTATAKTAPVINIIFCALHDVYMITDDVLTLNHGGGLAEVLLYQLEGIIRNAADIFAGRNKDWR